MKIKKQLFKYSIHLLCVSFYLNFTIFLNNRIRINFVDFLLYECPLFFLSFSFVQAVKFSTGEQERDTKLHRRGIRFLKRVVTIKGIERFGERA